MWTKIKQDRERHVQMLKDALKKNFSGSLLEISKSLSVNGRPSNHLLGYIQICYEILFLEK